MAEKIVRAFLDHLEGNTAVLLVGDEEARQVLWPAGDLPEDAVEGCVVCITIRTDPAATDARNSEIESLIDQLKREK